MLASLTRCLLRLLVTTLWLRRAIAGYTNTGDGEPLTHERPETQSVKNPFDLANASTTPEVIVSVPDPQDPEKAMIRVFDNKFPALTKPADTSTDTSTLLSGNQELTKVQVAFVDGLFPQVSAVGLHEVVVQHWRYNMCEVRTVVTRDSCRCAF